MRNYHLGGLIFLCIVLCSSLIAGCSLPLCHEGNVVCVDDSDGQFIIYQSDRCEGEDCPVEIDNKCQLYRCTGDDYELIKEAARCEHGSRIENGSLRCKNRCEFLPSSRCINNGSFGSIVQSCVNDGDDAWMQNTSCLFSCRIDEENDYESEDGYKAGVCGECLNSDEPYCQNIAGKELLQRVSCKNGTLVYEDINDNICPEDMRTKCDGSLVHLKNDRNHCGSCDNVCENTKNCINGKCETCVDGYLNYVINGETIRAFCIQNENDLIKVHDSLSMGEPYPLDNEANNYIIVEDINYTGEWQPLGTQEKPIDNLTLIGQNHTITFEKPILGEQYAGIFGVVTNSLFDSIHIENVSVSHAKDFKDIEDPMSDEAPAAGGFIGKMDNTVIQNSVFNAEVLGTANMGGVVGMASNSEFLRVTSSGKVTADPYESPMCESFEMKTVNMGGFAGYIIGTTITDSHSTTELMSNNQLPVRRVGGLVGTAMYACNIKNSSRDKDILISGSEIGGLIGYAYSFSLNRSISIENSRFSSGQNEDGGYDLLTLNTSYADSVKCGEERYISSNDIGGLIGKFESNNNGQLMLVTSTVNAKIIGDREVGGYIGYAQQLNQLSGFVTIDDCIKLEGSGCIQNISNDIHLQVTSNAGGIIGRASDNLSVSINNIQTEVEITELHPDTEDMPLGGNENIGGLIGSLASSLMVSDIKTDVKISMPVNSSAEEFIPEIDGYMHSDIFSHMSKQVAYSKKIGGLIGYSDSDSAILDDIELSFDVTGDSDIGGLYGNVYGTEIELNHTSVRNGNIRCNFNCGGIAGYYTTPYVRIPSYYTFVAQSDIFVLNDTNQFSDITIQGKSSIGGVIGALDHVSFESVSYSASNIQYNYNLFSCSKFDNLKIDGDSIIGGLVGVVMSIDSVHSDYGPSTINVVNCESIKSAIHVNMENIHGTMVLGGLLGYGSLEIQNNDINNIEFNENTASVVGGLVGAGDVKVTESHLGNIHIHGNEYVGGLVGMGKVELSSSEFTHVQVMGNHDIGAMAGNGSISLFNTAVSDVEVQGEENTGGLIGAMAGIASSWYIDISNNEMFNIHINGTYSVGGLVGMAANDEFLRAFLRGEISSSVLQLFVQGQTDVGGIVGTISADYVNSFLYFRQSGLFVYLMSLNTKSPMNFGGMFGNVSFSDLAISYFQLTFDNSYQYITVEEPNLPAQTGLIFGQVLNTEHKQDSELEIYYNFDDYYFSSVSLPFIGNDPDREFEGIEPFSIQNNQFLYEDQHLAEILDMESCMAKVLTSADGIAQCMNMPFSENLKRYNYDEVLDEYKTVLPSFCIPEDQIEAECGSL